MAQNASENILIEFGTKWSNAAKCVYFSIRDWKVEV